jgi:hypothetical protein
MYYLLRIVSDLTGDLPILGSHALDRKHNLYNHSISSKLIRTLKYCKRTVSTGDYWANKLRTCKETHVFEQHRCMTNLFFLLHQ